MPILTVAGAVNTDVGAAGAVIVNVCVALLQVPMVDTSTLYMPLFNPVKESAVALFKDVFITVPPAFFQV